MKRETRMRLNVAESSRIIVSGEVTGAAMKKLFRESAKSIGNGLHVSASHPHDGDGVLIQSELSAEQQEKLGHRFHWRNISADEVEELIAALKYSLRKSRVLRRRFIKGGGQL